jgi:hypothetical protein
LAEIAVDCLARVHLQQARIGHGPGAALDGDGVAEERGPAREGEIAIGDGDRVLEAGKARRGENLRVS